MTRDKREDYIYSRAYGLHLEPITIVAVLVKEGYPEAAEILDSRSCATICGRSAPANWPGVNPERPADAIWPPAPRKRRRKPPSNGFT